MHPYFRRGSQFVKGNAKALQWSCPHCPFVFEGDTSKAICLARYRHNVVAHKGSHQVGSLKSKVCLTVLLPHADVAWKCPRCQVGITVQDRNQISRHVFQKIRAKHRAVTHADIPIKEWRKLCTKPPTLSFRQKRRTHQLNSSTARRSIFSPLSSAEFEFFSWPFKVCVAKIPRISIRNAWRCRKCFRCFTELRDTRNHECRAILQSKCTHDRISAINVLFDSDLLPVGFDASQFHHILHVAVRALQGQPIDPS